MVGIRRSTASGAAREGQAGDPSWIATRSVMPRDPAYLRTRMFRGIAAGAFAWFAVFLAQAPQNRILAAPRFVRGDADGSGGKLNIGDAVSLLTYLFVGGRDVPCLDAADANDSDALDLADPVYILSYAFLGRARPPLPFPGCGVDPTPGRLPCVRPSPECESPLRFNDARFRATHNSYSGPSGLSITALLDRGVRFIEFDVHDNDFQSQGDYRIGHDSPGSEVFRGGNPAVDYLGSWLAVVAGWSRSHPDHAPITVALDLKDPLDDNHSYAEGNLAALNDRLLAAFGAWLFLPSQVGAAWGTVDSMRGRILTVLSGDLRTRDLYLRDPGRNPAVAMNQGGQVVEVHDSGSGDLWYWTGQLDFPGSISWRRHGRYDTGQTPAVTLRNDGWLVEVHQSESAATLWYHVGHLDGNYEIDWSPSHRYDTGVLPTVRLTSLDGADLIEIHRSENTSKNWTWDGALGGDFASVAWRGNRTTSNPRFDATFSDTGFASVSVFLGVDGDSLRYATNRLPGDGPIRYEQVAFVECQQGDEDDIACDALQFHAADAGSASGRAWGGDRQAAGKLVRLWGYDDPSYTASPSVSFPATDEPAEAWYEEYCTGLGVAD
jgi:hypothetical protein